MAGLARPMACPAAISVTDQATAAAEWRSEATAQTRHLLPMIMFNPDAKSVEYGLARKGVKATPARTQRTGELTGCRDISWLRSAGIGTL